MDDGKIEFEESLSRQNRQTEYSTERDPYNLMYGNDQRFNIYSVIITSQNTPSRRTPPPQIWLF
jgi:hypothetical protein